MTVLLRMSHALLGFVSQTIFILESRGIIDTELLEKQSNKVKRMMSNRWCQCQTRRNLPGIASLAHQRLLGRVPKLVLRDVDLTSVPAKHLASLAASVWWSVEIRNVSGCDLVTILDNIRIQDLFISRQRLSSKETEALLQALVSNVQRVWQVRLDIMVILDNTILIMYSGYGEERMRCLSQSEHRYKEQLRSWTRNWTEKCDCCGGFDIWREDVHVTRKRQWWWR